MGGGRGGGWKGWTKRGGQGWTMGWPKFDRGGHGVDMGWTRGGRGVDMGWGVGDGHRGGPTE